MPELMTIAGVVIVITMTPVSYLLIRRRHRPKPELLASEMHKLAFIATGDEKELKLMAKALEKEENTGG